MNKFLIRNELVIFQVGLDVGSHISKFLAEEFGERMTGKVNFSGVVDDLVAAGFMGRKAGKGFFIYDGTKGERPINDEAVAIVMKRSVPKPAVGASDEDLQMRLLLRFVNEAVLCLEEGVLDNPLEGDVGAVFGLGFPPFTGGPFRYVDQFTAQKVVDKMNYFYDTFGEVYWKPSQLLLDMAKDPSKKFHK